MPRPRKNRVDSSQTSTSEEPTSTESQPMNDGPANPPSSSDMLERYKDEKEETVRKRRKKYTKKGDVENEELQANMADFIAGIMPISSFILSFASRRLPNPVPPTPEETEMFNGALTTVIKRRFALLSGYDDLFALALASSIFVIPRLNREKSDSDTRQGRHGKIDDIPKTDTTVSASIGD